MTKVQADEASLDRGYTLPSEWYTDEELYRLERTAVFRRFWHYLGYVGRLREPGTFFTASLGHLPVIVARDDGGRIRAFVNVCQHRGTIVATGDGSCKLFQCPYHGWTYNLDGSLRRAPGMEENEGFDPKDIRLPPITVDQWGPFIFGTPEESMEPLGDYLGEFPELVARFGLDFSRLLHEERREYVMKANWKVVVENFLECYHCPTVHPGFAAVQDVRKYKFYGIGRYFTSQGGPVRPSAYGGNGKGDGEPRHHYTSELPEGCYSYIWPNFGFGLYPGATGATTMLWLPRGARETLAVFDFYYAEHTTEPEAAATTAFIDQVQREDMDIVSLVQQGLESGALVRGRLNLSRREESKCEIGLQHFQKLVYETLSSARG